MAASNPKEPRYLSVEQLEEDIVGEMDGVLLLKSTKYCVARRVDLTEDTREWVRGDAAFLSQLRHPSVVRCVQLLEAPAHLYIVLQQHPQTLKAFIQRSQRSQPVHLLLLMYQMADALAHIHSLSRLDPDTLAPRIAFHGNLSATSISLSDDTWHSALPLPRLCMPAGAAKRPAEPFTPYGAPETRSSGYYGPLVDMWSLGVVFYELLVGHAPQALEMRTMEGALREASVRIGMDTTVIGIIMEQLLASDPQRRISARALAEQLKMVLERVHRETIRDELFGHSVLKSDSLRIIAENAKEYAAHYMANIDVSEGRSLCAQYAELARVLPNELLASLRDILEGEEADVTTLMRAAESGDVALVLVCVPFQAGRLTTRGEQINGWGLRGRTALMGAALRGHFEVAQILAPYEAGLQQHYDGATALMMAAFMGHIRIVELLLKHEKGKQDTCGCTALTFATLKNRSDIVSMLMEHEGGLGQICVETR